MKAELYQTYTKYKQQILPLLLAILSIFIVLRVILPQISSISETNSLIESKQQELNTLLSSLRVLETTPDDTLENDFAIAGSALPISKDVSRLVEAMNSAARASNTKLGEFSFKIGGVFGKENASGETSDIGVPQASVVTRVSSDDPYSLILFAEKLSQTLPLSEIRKIDTVGNTGVFEVEFYYKPVDVNLISRTDRVLPLNQNDRNLLNQLKEWAMQSR
jgi:hypothetical protein